MTRFVNAEEFDEVTKEGFWIADFMTDHCGPCKMLDMLMSQIVYDNPEVNIAKCDIEKNPSYADRFHVMGTPTLLFMMDGEIKSTVTGFQSREVLEGMISEAMYG